MISKRTVVSLLLCLSALVAELSWSQDLAKAPSRRSEFFRPLPLTRFYDAPDPLPAAKPGELIRSAEFDEYNLPPEVNAIRLLYHSRTAAGQDVAVSGVLLFPEAKPPAGGWPIIAWAHSWTGVARNCAPSLARNLEHGPFLAMYVHLGYAVVATDYAGLGTSSRSAYADVSANAQDVINSVIAAHQALPQLGARWIAMGTGEGGMAVVGVEEQESGIHDPNYLGSVAISRLGDLKSLYTSESPLTYKLPLFLAYGIKTAYPKFEIKDMLTPAGISLYRTVAQQCSEGEDQAASQSSAASMLQPGWENNPFVQKYFDHNRLGNTAARAPLLVIASQDDPTIDETAKIVTRLCTQGEPVQYEKFAESDLGRVIGDSARDQMAWVQSRFANAPARSNCSAKP
ncbi:MAG TPA: lipase family protein [Terriglobales bacterium]|jgi:alpha-beta hydrolase superfamily lysophospholipase|nr:lipase family protein [Terriglobales bacterium]